MAGQPYVISDPITTSGQARARTNCTGAQQLSHIADHAPRAGVYWRYCAWYDRQPEATRLKLAKQSRASLDDPWPSTWTVDEGTLGINDPIDGSDPHNFPSLGIDDDGILHLAWRAHGTEYPMLYKRFTEPGDIRLDAVTAFPFMAGLSYPRFVLHTDRRLLMSARVGIAGGDAQQVLYEYSKTPQTWALVTAALMDWPAGGDEESPYLHTIAVNCRGELGISWLWAKGGGVDQYHDVMFISGKPTGGLGSDWVWYDKDGVEFALPANNNDRFCARRVPIDTGISVHDGLGWTPKGDPVIPFFEAVNGDNSGTNLRVMVRLNGVWYDRLVSRVAETWNYVGASGGHDPDSPTSSFAFVGTAQVMTRALSTYLVYSSTFELGSAGLPCVMVFCCHEPTLTSWSEPMILIDEPVGDSIPQHCPIAWKYYGQATFFIQMLDEEALWATPPETSVRIADVTMPEPAMGTLTTYAKNQILNKRHGRTADATPANWYIRLFLAGVECSGSGYAAAAVTNNATNFPAAAGRAKALAVSHDITATGGTLPFDEVRLYDHATAGNSWATHTLSGTVTLADGESAVFDATGGSQIAFSVPAGAWPDAETHAVLDYYWGAVAYTVTATFQFAYFDGDPQGAGAEITGTGYTRDTTTNDDTEWNAPSGGVATLTNPVELGTAGGDWDQATHAAIFRADGTTLLQSCTLPEVRNVLNGQTETISGARVRSQVA